MARTSYKRRYELFRTLLRDARVAAGIRQVELSERLGKTQSFVSKTELGERRMDVIDLFDYLSAIGKSPTAFVDELMQRLADATAPTKSTLHRPKETRGKS